MKKIVAAVLSALALACAVPVFAQEAPPDPAAVAAAREMFESMNYRDTMVKAMQQMSQQMAVTMRSAAESAIKNNPQLDDQARQQAMVRLEADLPARIAKLQVVLSDPTLVDDIIAESIPVWARTFSADELRQIAAFYRTPLGARMLAAMPQLMGESMRMGQHVMARRLSAAMQELSAAPAAKP